MMIFKTGKRMGGSYVLVSMLLPTFNLQRSRAKKICRDAANAYPLNESEQYRDEIYGFFDLCWKERIEIQDAIQRLHQES